MSSLLTFMDDLITSPPTPGSEDPNVQVYLEYQKLKWRRKNWDRAMGMSNENQNHETRAWESHKIDRDYPVFLEKYGVEPGSRVLDIGTEMGLQAVAIAEQGYAVTGTDVGMAELLIGTEYAKEKGVDVIYVQDDILMGEASLLTNHSYDVVLDRAVFHSMAPYLEDEPRIKEGISKR